MDTESAAVPSPHRRAGVLCGRANLVTLRVKKDMQELAQQRFVCNSASTAIEFPDGNRNLLRTNVRVAMSGGCYAGGTFAFELRIPSTYPFSAPEVTCLTRTWHPNINPQTGRVDLPVLSKDWRPVLSVNAVVFALQLMFLEPSPEHAANLQAAHVLQSEPALFEQQVKRTLQGGHFFGHFFEVNDGQRLDLDSVSGAKRKSSSLLVDARGLKGDLEGALRHESAAADADLQMDDVGCSSPPRSNKRLCINDRRELLFCTQTAKLAPPRAAADAASTSPFLTPGAAPAFPCDTAPFASPPPPLTSTPMLGLVPAGSSPLPAASPAHLEHKTEPSLPAAPPPYHYLFACSPVGPAFPSMPVSASGPWESSMNLG